MAEAHLLVDDIASIDHAIDRFLRGARYFGDVRSGVWLSPVSGKTLYRCWRLVKTPSFNAEVLSCKFLLLAAFSVAVPLFSDSCEDWAYLGLPGPSFVFNLQELRNLISNLTLVPISQKGGGVFFDIGGNRRAEFAERHLLPLGPGRLHLFEPVPEYADELRAYWKARLPSASVHNFGLGNETQFDVPVFLAGGSSSTYQQLHFSGRRMYVDSIGDGVVRNRGGVVLVTIRSVVDVWHGLALENLSLLSVNCEGCEYDVLPALSRAGLLGSIETIILQTHLVLTDQDHSNEVSAGNCDIHDGTCLPQASFPGINRYCNLQEILKQSHDRLWGMPFNTFQVWQLRSSVTISLHTGEHM